MSVYLSFDGGDPQDWASNTGHRDFVRWCDGLDAAKYPQLVHLAEYGWCQTLPAMASQLSAAVAASLPMEPTLITTAHELLSSVRTNVGADVLTITDGFGPDDSTAAFAVGFEPANHPHLPSGSPQGGQFAPTGGRGGVKAAVRKGTVAVRQFPATAQAHVNAVLRKLPESVRAPLANAYHGVHAAMMSVNHAAQALALDVAGRSGASPAGVARLGRVLAAADLAVPTALGLGLAATGNVVAGKLAAYVPAASMAYVLYSAAKNPARVLASAGSLLKQKFPTQVQGAYQYAVGAVAHPLTRQAAAHAEVPTALEIFAEFDPAKHPHGEHGHWAATGGGGAAAAFESIKSRISHLTFDQLRDEWRIAVASMSRAELEAVSAKAGYNFKGMSKGKMAAHLLGTLEAMKVSADQVGRIGGSSHAEFADALDARALAAEIHAAMPADDAAGEWWAALFAAALDDTGDVQAAVKMASEAAASQGEPAA